MGSILHGDVEYSHMTSMSLNSSSPSWDVDHSLYVNWCLALIAAAQLDSVEGRTVSSRCVCACASYQQRQGWHHSSQPGRL